MVKKSQLKFPEGLGLIPERGSYRSGYLKREGSYRLNFYLIFINKFLEKFPEKVLFFPLCGAMNFRKKCFLFFSAELIEELSNWKPGMNLPDIPVEEVSEELERHLRETNFQVME